VGGKGRKGEKKGTRAHAKHPWLPPAANDDDHHHHHEKEGKTTRPLVCLLLLPRWWWSSSLYWRAVTRRTKGSVLVVVVLLLVLLPPSMWIAQRLGVPEYDVEGRVCVPPVVARIRIAYPTPPRRRRTHFLPRTAKERMIKQPAWK